MYKRIIKICLSVSVLMLMFTCDCFAQTDLYESEYSAEYEKMLDGIPDDVADVLPEELFSDDMESVVDAVEEMTGFGYIIKSVLTVFGMNLTPSLKLLASLIGVILISAVLRSIAGLYSNSKNIGQALTFCTLAVTAGSITVEQYSQIGLIIDYLGRLNTFADSMIPIMSVMYTFGGNVAMAAVHNTAMTVFLTVCENICNLTVVPVTVICIAIAVCSAFQNSIDLRSITSFVKKTANLVLCFTMMIMMTVLSAQSLLSSAKDSITAKSAKFIAGSMIPVVGGAVGESLKTVAGSVGYLRSTVGTAGIIIIILMLLPALINVLMTRVAVMFTGVIAKILGCREEGMIMDELAGIYGYYIAVISVCSIIFIYELAILARTASAI